MKSRIIKIGNSQGIRIPKLLLEQSNITDEVDLEALDNQIIIRSAQHPRHVWDQAFQTMTENQDDSSVDDYFPNSTKWDEEEWQW